MCVCVDACVCLNTRGTNRHHIENIGGLIRWTDRSWLVIMVVK